MHRPVASPTCRLALLAILVAVSACDREPTAPAEATAFVVDGAGLSAVRSYRGAAGTYVLDAHTRTVRGPKGEVTQLDSAAFVHAARAYDHLAAIDAQMRRLKADPRVRARLEELSRTGRRASFRVSRGVASGSGAGQRLLTGTSPRRAAPRGIERVMGASGTSEECTDLELQIYSIDQHYTSLRKQYDDYLAASLLLGWGYSLDGSWGFSPERYATQFAAWAAAVDLLNADILADRIVLEYLAMQYSLLGCWNQTPAPGSGSGGGGASSGGSTCHYEYGVLEISYDGGLTWQTLYEGDIKVCESVE